MRKLDPAKLAKLQTADQWLEENYGKEGTPERADLAEKASNWYLTEMLRDRRKELKITQQELADKVGVPRSYITRFELGNSDIQLSNFLRIASALGVFFKPTF